MIRVIFAAVLCVLVAGSAVASGQSAIAPSTQPISNEGMVIKWKTTMQMQGRTVSNEMMILKVKGSCSRLDVGSMMSAICLEDGTTKMVMHMTRTCMVQTPGQVKQSTEAAAEMMGSAAATAEATGRKEKIGGCDAEAYLVVRTIRGQEHKQILWVAKDYPEASKLEAAMKRFQNGNKQMQWMGDRSSISGLPEGMIVRSETDLPNDTKAVTELVSAQAAEVADAEFAVPAGYSEQILPATPIGQ